MKTCQNTPSLDGDEWHPCQGVIRGKDVPLSLLCKDAPPLGGVLHYKERFINIVSDLSILHMQILKYYLDREGIFKKENRKGADAFTSIESVSKQFELAKSQAEAFCNDLLRYNLLYDDAIGKYGYKRGRFRIADNAIDFVNFILLEN